MALSTERMIASQSEMTFSVAVTTTTLAPGKALAIFWTVLPSLPLTA